MSTEHHPMGFSRLGRIARCPASVNECRDISDRPSPGATRGRKLHFAFESGDTFGLSAFDAWGVSRCMERREELIGEISPDEATKTTREVRLDLVLPAAKIFGTLDSITRFRRGALHFDAKFHPTGDFDEESARWQLLAGNCAILQVDKSLKGVLGVAFCPFGSEGEVQVPTRREDLDHELGRINDVIAAAIDAGKSPEVGYHPGPACKYCPARGKCREAVESSRALAAVDDSGLVRKGAESWEVLNDKAFSERLIRVKEAIGILQEHKKFLSQAALSAFAAGWESKFIQERSSGATASIDNHEAAWDSIGEELQKILLEVLKRKFTVGDLARAIRRLDESKSETVARKLAKDKLGDLLKYKMRSPSIALKKGVTL